MARGGARPGAGRPARKSANTSPVSRRARTHAREAAENQRPWPADKVERWQIDRLIPYAKKARTHTDAQAVLGISESEYVTRFTNVTYTDWVMRCTPRKVLRTAEQERDDPSA